MNRNGWRTMWLLATFDCPVTQPEQRKAYHHFHELLLAENFSMHQFSVYLKHFPTLAAAEAEITRLSREVPPGGKLSCFLLTDKQFGMTRDFFGPRLANSLPQAPEQVELF